jgi:hypothetical protein
MTFGELPLEPETFNCRCQLLSHTGPMIFAEMRNGDER